MLQDRQLLLIWLTDVALLLLNHRFFASVVICLHYTIHGILTFWQKFFHLLSLVYLSFSFTIGLLLCCTVFTFPLASVFYSSACCVFSFHAIRVLLRLDLAILCFATQHLQPLSQRNVIPSTVVFSVFTPLEC